MPRIQFFEIHEQPWFPTFLRDEVTDALQFGLNFLGVYAPIAPLLQSALERAGSRTIVDMCSGGGGPWTNLVRQLRGDARPARIYLTDKFPNLAAFENLRAAFDDRITFYDKPVDAANVPRELDGFRTMFTSFHHFPPGEARAILQNAVASRHGIAIFEVTRRAPAAIVLMLPWILLPLFFTPFLRPFRWSRLLFTYLVPVIPVVMLFDGIVSCLRTYRPEELRAISSGLGAPEYQWEAGEHSGFAQLPITYLVGYPRPHESV